MRKQLPRPDNGAVEKAQDGGNMAIQKNKLDFFSFDVDFFSDYKIKALRAAFGAGGIIFYQYILCQIYGNEGYYMRLDSDYELIMADDMKVTADKIGQMLNFLLKRSLFDDTLFQSDKVLTSHGIQARWQRAIKSKATKTPREVNERFWLLKESETEPFIKVTHFSEFSEKKTSFSEKNEQNSTKMKTNKMKLNNTILNNNKGNENSEKMENQENPVVVVLRNQVRNFIKEPLSDKDIDSLLVASDSDIVLISDKYKTAQTSNPKNLIGFMITAIRNDYAVSSKSQDSSGRKQNRFVNFEQRKWDFDAIEEYERQRE